MDCFAIDFRRVPVYSAVPKGIQTKLKLNTPGDIYEQEADRVATHVMSVPEDSFQPRCLCGGECRQCKAKHSAQGHRDVQRKAVQPTGVPKISVPPIVEEVLRSTGRPLDANARDFFEARFGYDFSGVRVHTDARSVESARLVNALAYTSGRDIVFGAGQYAPHRSPGKRLLAHELAHVIQQRGLITSSRRIQLQPVDCTHRVTGVETSRNPTQEVIEAHSLAVGYAQIALRQIEALRSGMHVPIFVQSSVETNFGSPNAAQLAIIGNRFTSIINRLSKGTGIYHCNTAGSDPCHICDQPHPGSFDACTPCPSTGGQFTRLCPPFFQVGSVVRALTLVHEAGHAAGACGDVYARDTGYPGPNPAANTVSYERFAKDVALMLGTIPYRKHTPTAPQ